MTYFFCLFWAWDLETIMWVFPMIDMSIKFHAVTKNLTSGAELRGKKKSWVCYWADASTKNGRNPLWFFWVLFLETFWWVYSWQTCWPKLMPRRWNGFRDGIFRTDSRGYCKPKWPFQSKMKDFPWIFRHGLFLWVYARWKLYLVNFMLMELGLRAWLFETFFFFKSACLPNFMRLRLQTMSFSRI